MANEQPVVFIGGMGRSGTTLLLKLLDGHPDLMVIPVESLYFRQVLPKLTDEGLTAALQEIRTTLVPLSRIPNAPDIEELLQCVRERFIGSEFSGRDLLDCLFSGIAELTGQQNRSLRVEKTPRNELYWETISKWYDNARLIFIVRDPRGVYASHKRSKKYTPPDAQEVARAWQHNYSRRQALADDEAVIFVRYEDLVGEQTEQTMRSIAQNLGINWHPSLMEPTELGNPWKGNSFDSTRNSSYEIRADHADAWRQDLTPGEIATLEKGNAASMKTLGYEPVAATNQPTGPADQKSANSATVMIDALSDDELGRLNKLLPWSAFSLDSKGRRFGKPFSAIKRTRPEALLDKRIEKLHNYIPLTGLHVLEMGCFEGYHTQALCQLAKRVTAVDARIEHVVKTIVRCNLMGHTPAVYMWNLEEGAPDYLDSSCDVLHHVGVLYHLARPVEHLIDVSKGVRKGLLLDCHVAPSDHGKLERGDYDDFGYDYLSHSEPGRNAPFAGMQDHAKWLTQDSLEQLLKRCGYDILESKLRQERNGPRVEIYAAKAG